MDAATSFDDFEMKLHLCPFCLCYANHRHHIIII